MNLKKILILPVGFIITNFLYVACCKCPEATYHYYEVLNAAVKPLGSGEKIIDNGIPITVDTVYLNYSLISKCVAKAKTDFSFLVNSAYACKCPECGRGGLKNKLTSIEITSDNVFNGIAANGSLKSFFMAKDYYSNTGYSIDSLISIFNKKDNFLRTYSLFTKTKPGNTAGHKLKLTMSFANSTAVTVVANPIIWQ